MLVTTISPSKYVPSLVHDTLHSLTVRIFLFCLYQTAKIGSLVDIQDSEDPEGLRVFYYLVQDLKVRSLDSYDI